MPHPRNTYVPGDAPPDLEGQTDLRIRNRLDGSHLLAPEDLFQPLMAALPGLVAGPVPANPNALLTDREVFEQGVRYFLAHEAASTHNIFGLQTKLAGCAVAAVHQNDPVYGTRNALQMVPVVAAQIDPLLPAMVDAWYAAPLRVRPEPAVVALFTRFDTLAAYSVQGNEDALGAAYLAAHPASGAFVPALTPALAKYLAEGLMKLTPVETALAGAMKAPLKQGINPRWSTAPLVDTAESDHDTEKSSLIVEKDVSETFESIRTALRAVSNLVAPAVHQRLPLPRFTVHKIRGKESNIRAYNDAGNVTITIGQPDGPDVVAHEVGHVIENVLPLGCWLDLMRLLHARHAAAGGGNLLPLYPGHSDPEVARECGYRAVMPAYPAGSANAGSYSARVYGGSSPTEVLSTTLELLMTPKGTKKLLDTDPQLLAVVLRWLLGPDLFPALVSGQVLANTFPTPLL